MKMPIDWKEEELKKAAQLEMRWHWPAHLYLHHIIRVG